MSAFPTGAKKVSQMGGAKLNGADYYDWHLDPAVVISNWVAFIILAVSAVVIGVKLMQFKGPSEQPEDYYFGYGPNSTASSLCWLSY
jgi:hypothetical protein